MSSSAPQRQAERPTGGEASPFAYAEAQVPNAVAGGTIHDTQFAEEQIRRQLAEASERGRQDAQQQLRSECDAALVRNRQQISEALGQFALERQNYYRRIEGEVVELALAIARKVLHREVQIDPNALAGIVRVTLEKLDTATQVHVYVPLREGSEWRHYFAGHMPDAPAPEVHEDASMPAGECRIETSLGSTEIGVQSQLKEIESGLLDLLAERPDATARSVTSAVTSTVAAMSNPK